VKNDLRRSTAAYRGLTGLSGRRILGRRGVVSTTSPAAASGSEGQVKQVGLHRLHTTDGLQIRSARIRSDSCSSYTESTSRTLVDRRCARWAQTRPTAPLNRDGVSGMCIWRKSGRQTAPARAEDGSAGAAAAGGSGSGGRQRRAAAPLPRCHCAHGRRPGGRRHSPMPLRPRAAPRRAAPLPDATPPMPLRPRAAPRRAAPLPGATPRCHSQRKGPRPLTTQLAGPRI
jgi:hypothetical protein